MPSEKILMEKQQVVTELKDKIFRAQAGVLVDYKGITVDQDTKLRAELRKAGVEYAVVKNTLTHIAVKGTGLEKVSEVLFGTTALAISYDDVVAPAKVISQYASKNDKFKIKCGFADGKVLSADEVKVLAELPPKEVLIAKMLGGLNAPITGFVNVLNGNLRGLACVLNAIAEQKAAAVQ
ncbi:50S ribosomal protein L10 [bioreactor metagenome]|uniref:50S ribosomal protein L10 n=1 Tax=bioreactor metagenome TaxID=1076179 RepID=A0A644X783_9ZZZZ